MFGLFVLVPAAWVWFRPSVTSFGICALCGAIAAMIFVTGGAPPKLPWDCRGSSPRGEYS